MAQHKATLRKSLRSALSNKVAADAILDSISSTQAQFNALMVKLDADTATTTFDTDYSASLSFANSIFADVDGSGQHKASLRKTLRSAMAHKGIADETLDSLEELNASFNALLTKLDADAGTLSTGNDAYDVIVTSEPVGDGPHKASYRRTLTVALSHSSLADAITDGIQGLQAAVNATNAQLNTDAGGGAMLGNYLPLQVAVIDAD